MIVMTFYHNRAIPIYQPSGVLGFAPLTNNATEIVTWTQVPDGSTYHAIYWLTEGSGNLRIDDDQFEIRPNSLCTILPGQQHSFAVDLPLRGYALYFKEDCVIFNVVARQISHQIQIFKYNPLIHTTSDEANALNQYIANIYREIDSPTIFQVDALKSLAHLFILQFQRANADIDPTKETTSDRGGNNKQRIEHHFYHLVDSQFATTHRLSDYARQLGVSPGHLNRIIKSDYGSSASTYIRQRVITQSKRLLINSEMSAMEIAAAVGFADSSYFSRFFKRETGQSPLEFRQNWNK